MKTSVILLVAVAVCTWALSAKAEWDPQNPDPRTKWVQLPDPNGWDVKATTPKILADDFLCRETGWITDIHLWGSWKGDAVGEFSRVHLSFHSDIPASCETDYSRPGETLWCYDFDPRQVPGFEVVPVGTGDQGWYDPNTGEAVPSDHEGLWQVNVQLDEFIPACDLFYQKAGNVYWLDVQFDAYCAAADVDFGWKTSSQHWNDDAVWGDWAPGTVEASNENGRLVEWYELRDPRTECSLDMAFVLTGTPDTLVPEPGLMATSGLGLLALLVRRRAR